ncbi:MAG: hypothetical protein KC414_00145 [Romboutsia sp.]|nr:hypothetical protein [Romboutsia sp.]
MAMDKETFNIDSHHSYLTSCFKNKSDLWVKRVKVLNNVIDNNINCLHVDVDIIINQNPFNYFKMLLLHYPSLNLFFGQGSIWPPEIYHKNGFVIRGGFHYTISTELSKTIWQQFCLDCEKFNDDQRAFNHVIDNLVEWGSSNDYYNEKYGNIEYKCYKTPIFGNIEKEEIIVLLPHNLFARTKINGFKECIVYHHER